MQSEFQPMTEHDAYAAAMTTETDELRRSDLARALRAHHFYCECDICMRVESVGGLVMATLPDPRAIEAALARLNTFRRSQLVK